MSLRDQRPADLCASRIPVRMQNSRSGMSAFTRAQQHASFPVESRTPLDKFGDALRPFCHKDFSGGPKHQSIACSKRVVQVQDKVFRVLPRGHRDAALRVERI